MKQFLSLVDQFFFSPVSLKEAAVLRILTAILVVVSLLYGDENLWSTPFPKELYSAVFLTWWYKALIILCACVFGLGWKPRIFGLLLFFLFLPYAFMASLRQSRQVLLIVVLAMTFIPQFKLWRWFKQEGDGAVQNCPIWPIRLVQIQLSLLYGVNAVYKTSWSYLSGEVNAELSRAPNFLVDLSSGSFAFGEMMIPLSWVSIATVVTEYFLAIGFWCRRLALAVMAVGLLFHYGLTFVISIGMLDYISIFLYLFFILPRLEWCKTPKVSLSK